MTAIDTPAAIREARSVGDATSSLARALARGRSDHAARERLTHRAELAVGTLEQSTEPETVGRTSQEDLLAAALSQISIGSALLTTESALASSDGRPLQRVAEMLEGTAATLEAESATSDAPSGFDAAPGGVPLDVGTAARAALDEMAEAAGDVATALLDHAMKPLVDKVPADWQDAVSGVLPAVGGQLAQWGIRAIRGGLKVISSLVDVAALESLRQQLDDLLSRLGEGRDATVLLGTAIGAERVSASVARIPAEQRDPSLVQQLSGLAARYHRLCRLLRQVAVAILGVAVALAVAVGVGIPALAAFSAGALVTVLAAAVVLGRDHTGATDLPGHTRGVGILIRRLGDVSA